MFRRPPPQRPGTTSRRTAPRPWHADVIVGARRRGARTPAMTSNTTRIGIMRAITAHAITREATITSTTDMSYHLGLTPRAIIDAAVEASRGDGLESWSLRDLAGRLHVTPPTLYHHVGGQELLRQHVVGRVLTMIDFPTESGPWREWFRSALFPARPVLAMYPGTAKWLLLHGPIFTSMVPVVDAGIASLQQSGFGEITAYAYATLFNTALMTISSADDKLRHEEAGIRDHATLMSKLNDLADTSPGMSLLVHDMAAQFTSSADSSAAARDRYYRFVVERLMDGLEETLRNSRSAPQA